MLKKIRLTNFKKFEDFSVSLRRGNILVGPNNSGKTTVLDAIRIVDSCKRYSLRRRPEVMQLDDGRIFDGHIVPEDRIVSNLVNSIHNYNEEDAVIKLEDENGAIACVLLNRDRPVRFFIDNDGERLTSVNRFNRAFPTQFTIVPTLGPLEENERWVEDETIRRGELSRLSSRHLRNVWYRNSHAEFEDFRRDVEDAWRDITISKPERQYGNPQILEMYYSENRLDREVFWSGLGFQIWLQLLTHVKRAVDGAVIIIDEPDIYLHPEVQKRLLRIVRDRSEQFIFATHSIELINEADALEIVSVDPRLRNAKRIRSEEDYNTVYGYLGSSQNVELARIAKARKVIFVEGNDKKIIMAFAKRFGFDRLYSGAVPFVGLGGFGGWEKAKYAVWTFREILDLEVAVHCVFDRDYRCEPEIAAFEREFGNDGIPCNVLRRKEIENYLLDLPALHRAIGRRCNERGLEVLSQEALTEIVDVITERMKDRVWAAIDESARHFIRRGNQDSVDCNVIRREFDESWADLSNRLRMVPGKELLRRLNEELQDLGISALTPNMIVSSMGEEDIDPGFRDLLQELEEFAR